MTRQQIEYRITAVQRMLDESTHVEDLKALTQLLGKLILMDADDDE